MHGRSVFTGTIRKPLDTSCTDLAAGKKRLVNIFKPRSSGLGI